MKRGDRTAHAPKGPEKAQTPNAHPPLPQDPAQCLESDLFRRDVLVRRVLQKIEDSEGYSFTQDELRMFTAFFDLSLEFDARRDFLTLCVVLPMIFFDQDCRLYLRTGPGAWKLARCLRLPEAPLAVEPPPHPAMRGSNFFAPVPARKDTGELMGFDLPDNVMGWLELSGGVSLSRHKQIFFEKFAVRIGHQMHYRLARAKNREHLAFIQNLVEDIGHNVIVPNMIFKLFFNRLNASITALARCVAEAPPETPADFTSSLDFLQARLGAQYAEISRHYSQTSLFLETLLRRRHFQEGRYVLEKRRVNLLKQVVEPQVERYLPRLEDRGIAIDLSMGGIPDEPILLMADLGLIAQVYANLFSNAVKYTRTVSGPNGEPLKFMAYGWEIRPDALGEDRPGAKLNVFTTGPVVPESERAGLFLPGYRSSSAEGEHGTGHGLAFVHQVVQLHGGRVGYEPSELGNNFYIVLPVETGE
ncbi:MAG: HAMP domain-containing histidine kinase [Proteobacteria bacterium]|nr:HAMP domain-containing histidine kinase [Pseudomonadota bacterium]MBU1594026.1 HAMP domain-containing histidine kinase [Pseudomonadota bacterium]